jgi:hypothetical protein
MPKIDDTDFLRKYQIEFPPPSALAVIHAEPVSVIKGCGYTFSTEALDLISELVAPSERTAAQFNRSIASSTQVHEQILVFLDGPYRMAHHIGSVRNSKSEIAMVSCVSAENPTRDNPPPVGLLAIADVPTLIELAQRSPFLGQLLPIVDGPPDDAIWAYFLGRIERIALELEESVEVKVC